MKQVENLLRHTMGLHAATIGPSLVEHAVRARMRHLSLTKQEEYVELLRKSPTEWNTLVESMVVTETWFFRERQPFAALVRLAVEEWLPAHPSGLLRVLSLPCSTGEEPYSMAMALLEAGFPATRFDIDAVDISSRALAFAQRAVYGRNSFRGPDLEFRERFFQSTHGSYALNPAVRRQVRFQKGNVLDEGCLAEAGAYDFIFCRNLLIYFDRPTQDTTLAKLRRLLRPTGVLFTGSAEQALALNNGFAALDLSMSFACRRRDARARAAKDMTEVAAAGPGAMQRAAEEMAVNGEGTAARGLTKARELLGEGRFAEVAELCETHVRECGASAEAFYLLGLVRQTAGADSQASEYYRKALYLEPAHPETIEQWATLSERSGNAEHARILRGRVARRNRRNDQASSLWEL